MDVAQPLSLQSWAQASFYLRVEQTFSTSLLLKLAMLVGPHLLSRPMLASLKTYRPSDKAAGAFGTVDVWINNVGVGALKFFWDIPIEDHAKLGDVNLKGLIYGAHVALSLFRT